MSNGVKSDMRSVVLGSVVVTALAITVASFVKSKSNTLCFYFVSLLLGGYSWRDLSLYSFFFVFELCNSSIDETLVEGSVISSIDKILVEDRNEFRILLLSI